MIREKDALDYLRDQRIVDGAGKLVDARTNLDGSVSVYVNDQPAYKVEILVTDLNTNRMV